LRCKPLKNIAYSVLWSGTGGDADPKPRNRLMAKARENREHPFMGSSPTAWEHLHASQGQIQLVIDDQRVIVSDLELFKDTLDRCSAGIHVGHRFNQKEIFHPVYQGATRDFPLLADAVDLPVEVDDLKADVMARERVFQPWVTKPNDGFQSLPFRRLFLYCFGGGLFRGDGSLLKYFLRRCSLYL